MGTVALSRYTVSISAAALLAACGGLQPPIGAPSAMTQSRAIATHAERGGSWMVADTKNEALLYVATTKQLDVLSYPGYQIVGKLQKGADGFGPVTTNPNNGDVLVETRGVVYEYAHGGKSPIGRIDTQEGYGAADYAFDPSNDDIAIAYQKATGAGEVWVFQSISGTPTKYSIPNVKLPYYLGYDAPGDLFIQGQQSANGAWVFAELPKNGTSFFDISLNQEITNMGSVQWDGSYITIASGSVIYQIQVSGSAGTVIGETILSKAWAKHPVYWIQDGVVMGPYASRNHKHNGRDLALWPYPAGGGASKVIGQLSTSNKDRIISAAVSVASSKPR